jgi:hypothetical protein
MATPPIAHSPGDGAARVSVLRQRNDTGFLRRPACAHIEKRLVVETHDARLRFSASATVRPLAGSDMARYPWAISW